jgi:hypothetical protein
MAVLFSFLARKRNLATTKMLLGEFSKLCQIKPQRGAQMQIAAVFLIVQICKDCTKFGLGVMNLEQKKKNLDNSGKIYQTAN